MSPRWLDRGSYRLRDRYDDEQELMGRDLCRRCREPIPKGAGECGACRRESERKDEAVGKLHASIDRLEGYAGDLAVTCHTPEAEEAFGVSGPGPWAFDRAEAWRVADRLQARYGDGAVFS